MIDSLTLEASLLVIVFILTFALACIARLLQARARPSHNLTISTRSLPVQSSPTSQPTSRPAELTKAPSNFLTIPGELRNQIYELCFTTNGHSALDSTIDLRDRLPPNKNLLLVCRQAYNEAGSLYREAYRKYWTEGQFSLNLTERPLNRNARRKFLRSIKPADFAHIQNLRITRTARFANRDIDICIVRIQGGWRVDRVGRPGWLAFGVTYEGNVLNMDATKDAAGIAAAAPDPATVEPYIKEEVRFLLCDFMKDDHFFRT